MKKVVEGEKGVDLGREEDNIEDIMNSKEREPKFCDSKLTEQGGELVLEEMVKKFDEEEEKRAEDLVEEQIKKDEWRKDDNNE